VASFTGLLYPNAAPIQFRPSSFTEAVFLRAPQRYLDETALRLNDPPALAATGLAIKASGFTAGGAVLVAPGNNAIQTAQEYSEGAPNGDWFERMHVVPRSFSLGNVLATQTIGIEVFNAYRKQRKVWIQYVNGAGQGTDLQVLPALPTFVERLYGIQMDLVVSPNGPPVVDAILEFEFEDETLLVPIDFDRIVLIAPDPEKSYSELLAFETDVIEHKDETEQRIRLRKAPRQLFGFRYVLEDGTSRQRLENSLFDWQHRAFGIVLWHERTRLSQAASLGDVTVNVPSTAFADYRIGGLYAVYRSEDEYDVLELDASSATSLTATGALSRNYPVGTFVAPVRLAYVDGEPEARRWPNMPSEVRLKFETTDNDVDLADASAFPTLSGKVLLDDPNLIEGTASERFSRPLVILDPIAGEKFQDSKSDRHRKVGSKGFFIKGAQRLWEVRRLLHFLGGRQVAFYVPTFAKDLTPILQLTSGSNALDVANVGYARFVRNRQPKNIIWVQFTDGTSLTRTITASVEVDATRETLTLNTTWPANRPVSEVKRISYVEEVRMDSDLVEIAYSAGGYTAKVIFPTRTVLE
jgi:hypothetical protein